jgi:phosphohistidine phosphatase SixA
MRTNAFRWVWLLAGLPVLLGAESAQTVILVRHAERAGGMAPEVGLSKAGRCRAQVLTGMLADAGVTHIFTSDVVRTQQTAEPLAKKLGLRPEAVAGKDYDTLIGKLRVAGGVTLVVGHSNTLPEIISRLGAGTVAPIADSDYDRLFVVTITGGQASVVMLHYSGCGR